MNLLKYIIYSLFLIITFGLIVYNLPPSIDQLLDFYSNQFLTSKNEDDPLKFFLLIFSLSIIPIILSILYLFIIFAILSLRRYLSDNKINISTLNNIQMIIIRLMTLYLVVNQFPYLISNSSYILNFFFHFLFLITVSFFFWKIPKKIKIIFEKK